MDQIILFGKYKILRSLGSGGYGDIYLAEHIKLKVFRAIKRICKKTPLYEQLLNEADILKNLKHSNIPVIYDIEEDEEFSYIIEEYIKGKSLKVYKFIQGKISERNILDYTIQLCELLIYLHSIPQPVLYLDLKPDNILICDGTLKLIDFGAAMYYKDGGSPYYSMGTKGYASPEQYSLKGMDERSDIYGIGMLMFFLITGESFNGNIKNVWNINKIGSCSKDLRNTIEKCLEYYPSQRYSTVENLKNTLLNIEFKGKRKRFLSDSSLTISIAGSQSRIGTTHTAILLSSYINTFLDSSIYIPTNNNSIINSLIKESKLIMSNPEICRIKNLDFLLNYEKLREEDTCFEMYPYKVVDFGMVTEENKENFLKGDLKIVVLGGKEWEIGNTLKTIKIMGVQTEVKYIFNYTDGSLFKNIIKNLDISNCFRMPYIPNCFCTNNEIVHNFFQILLKEYGINKNIEFNGKKNKKIFGKW